MTKLKKIASNNGLLCIGFMLNAILMVTLPDNNHIGQAFSGFVLGCLLVGMFINLRRLKN